MYVTLYGDDKEVFEWTIAVIAARDKNIFLQLEIYFFETCSNSFARISNVSAVIKCATQAPPSTDLRAVSYYVLCKFYTLEFI